MKYIALMEIYYSDEIKIKDHLSPAEVEIGLSLAIRRLIDLMKIHQDNGNSSHQFWCHDDMVSGHHSDKLCLTE